MKRTPRWSGLAGAVIAALSLMYLTPTLNAQRYGYYNGGGYGRGYGGYSSYGQGPYVYGPPAGYSYPAYGGYGYQRYGAGPYGYGSPRQYPGQSYSPYRAYNRYRAYSPYNMSLYSSPYDDPYYAP